MEVKMRNLIVRVISFVEHPEMSNTTSTEESQKNAAQRRAQGEFVRGISACRNVIGETTDEAGMVLYPAEPNRYHLFIAFNCPWCHRTALARNILGLEERYDGRMLSEPH
jgi:putative glutathione S-transferase